MVKSVHASPCIAAHMGSRRGMQAQSGSVWVLKHIGSQAGAAEAGVELEPQQAPGHAGWRRAEMARGWDTWVRDD